MDQDASGWKHIYASSTATVYAEHDYWKPAGGAGGGPPVVGGSGTVYYTPWLTSDPETAPAVASSGEPGPIVVSAQEVRTAGQTNTSIDSLWMAKKLALSGAYEKAARIYQDIITTTQESGNKLRAILGYGHLLVRSGDSGMMAFLQNQYAKAEAMRPQTGMVLTKAYLSTGDTTKALALMGKLIAGYPSSEAVWYLHTVAFNLSFHRGDLPEAENQYQIMSRQYPSSSIQKRILLRMEYLLNQADHRTPYASSPNDNNSNQAMVTKPAVTALQSAYPNPFNPTTTIRYQLARTGPVKLTVWNILGRRVATLFSGTQQEGVHQVTFDASRLASGVYFYRLQAGNKVLVKKMLLMK